MSVKLQIVGPVGGRSVSRKGIPRPRSFSFPFQRPLTTARRSADPSMLNRIDRGAS